MAVNGNKSNGRRRGLLDLAPLERECMLILWPMGEATVREIREGLAESLPRAYTTIMTIMDRLARKGVVTRSKVGRGYLYRPTFTAEEARTHAVAQLVEHFFEGSAEALAAHLQGGRAAPVRRSVPQPARREPEPSEVEPLRVARPLDDTLL